MTIRDLTNAKELKKINFSREEISLMAIAICEEVSDEKNYKGAIRAIGRMKALCQCINDSYWAEKMREGYEKERFNLLKLGARKERKVFNERVKETLKVEE